MFSNGRTGQNIWVHKILSRYTENSASEVDPRLENKNTEIPSKLENAYIVSETLKPTTLASGNNSVHDELAVQKCAPIIAVELFNVLL